MIGNIQFRAVEPLPDSPRTYIPRPTFDPFVKLYRDEVARREGKNPVAQKPKKPDGRGWRKSTHCMRGHEYTPETIYMTPKGRECRLCKKLRSMSAMSSKKRPKNV